MRFFTESHAARGRTPCEFQHLIAASDIRDRNSLNKLCYIKSQSGVFAVLINFWQRPKNTNVSDDFLFREELRNLQNFEFLVAFNRPFKLTKSNLHNGQPQQRQVRENAKLAKFRVKFKISDFVLKPAVLASHETVNRDDLAKTNQILTTLMNPRCPPSQTEFMNFKNTQFSPISRKSSLCYKKLQLCFRKNQLYTFKQGVTKM